MKLVISSLLILLFSCNPQESTIDNTRNVSIKAILEIVELRERSEVCYGLLFKVKLRNNTGQKIFLTKPDIQTWKVYDDSLQLTSVHAPIDIKLDIYPADYFSNIGDEHKNRAFSLADSILKQQNRLPNRVDIQRKIFASSIIFLNPSEETEVITGVTFLKEFGRSFKLVASNRRPIEDFNKILGKIPPTFQGYYLWKGSLLSDTLQVQFR